MLCKTKKWGNSIGVIIPKNEAKQLKIGENEEVFITIEKVNPLKELFGFDKECRMKKEVIAETRKLLEGRW